MLIASTQTQGGGCTPHWSHLLKALQSLTKVLSLIHVVETTANNLTFN